MMDYADTDFLALDYDAKLKMLQAVIGELLKLKMRYAKISGEHATLRADLMVLKEVKSALQSALRAEG